MSSKETLCRDVSPHLTVDARYERPRIAQVGR